jgi:hypothetical protein
MILISVDPVSPPLVYRPRDRHRPAPHAAMGRGNPPHRTGPHHAAGHPRARHTARPPMCSCAPPQPRITLLAGAGSLGLYRVNFWRRRTSCAVRLPRGVVASGAAGMACFFLARVCFRVVVSALPPEGDGHFLPPAPARQPRRTGLLVPVEQMRQLIVLCGVAGLVHGFKVWRCTCGACPLPAHPADQVLRTTIY